MRSLESPLSRSVGLALGIHGDFGQLSPIVITVIELIGKIGEIVLQRCRTSVAALSQSLGHFAKPVELWANRQDQLAIGKPNALGQSTIASEPCDKVSAQLPCARDAFRHS